MATFGTALGTVGAVGAIPGGGTPAIMHIGGVGNSIVLTSVGFSLDANVQFMHSLRNVVYVYSFGERMGVIEINGIIFYRPCGGVTAGMGGALGFYRANSVAAKSSPVSITIANASFRGFVRGIRSTFSDPEKGIIGVSIVVATLPGL